MFEDASLRQAGLQGNGQRHSGSQAGLGTDGQTKNQLRRKYESTLSASAPRPQCVLIWTPHHLTSSWADETALKGGRDRLRYYQNSHQPFFSGPVLQKPGPLLGPGPAHRRRGRTRLPHATEMVSPNVPQRLPGGRNQRARMEVHRGAPPPASKYARPSTLLIESRG